MPFAQPSTALRPDAARPDPVARARSTAAILALPPRPYASTRGGPTAVPTGALPSADEVLAALARVLGSVAFRQSARHRALLRYVVEAVLSGRAHELKEVVLALDVFGRTIDGFDPRRDSIVRVEARRLRTKLARYYAGDGAGDPLEIRCTAGSYVPTFVVRDPEGFVRAARRSAQADDSSLFAVLPFSVRSDDGPGYASSTFCVGLADHIVDRLGRLDCSRVLAPASAAALRARAATSDTLLAEHGVDYVVEGVVAASGTRLRCTVHLWRTRDRRRRWTAVFDVATDALDAFAWRDDVASAVVEAVVAERAG